jgi:hypothetical protein
MYPPTTKQRETRITISKPEKIKIKAQILNTK